MQTVLKRTMNDKEYLTFYGFVCERLILREIELRNQPAESPSELRKYLLNSLITMFQDFMLQDKSK